MPGYGTAEEKEPAPAADEEGWGSGSEYESYDEQVEVAMDEEEEAQMKQQLIAVNKRKSRIPPAGHFRRASQSGAAPAGAAKRAPAKFSARAGLTAVIHTLCFSSTVPSFAIAFYALVLTVLKVFQVELKLLVKYLVDMDANCINVVQRGYGYTKICLYTMIFTNLFVLVGLCCTNHHMKKAYQNFVTRTRESHQMTELDTVKFVILFCQQLIKVVIVMTYLLVAFCVICFLVTSIMVFTASGFYHSCDNDETADLFSILKRDVSNLMFGGMDATDYCENRKLASSACWWLSIMAFLTVPLQLQFYLFALELRMKFIHDFTHDPVEVETQRLVSNMQKRKVITRRARRKKPRADLKPKRSFLGWFHSSRSYADHVGVDNAEAPDEPY